MVDSEQSMFSVAGENNHNKMTRKTKSMAITEKISLWGSLRKRLGLYQQIKTTKKSTANTSHCSGVLIASNRL